MTSRVQGVLDALGTDICAGRLAPGSSLTAEEVQARTATSRSAVREALATLVSLGLLRVRRRIGYEVAPPARWQALAPQVLRWRLTGPDAATVAAELASMRAAVEPAAAARAAAAATAPQQSLIADAAAAMWTAAVVGDRDRFVRDDERFHDAVLAASGNSLFAALGAVIVEALPGRVSEPEGISLDEAHAHREISEAISRRDADAAAELMRRVVARGVTA